jgi:hypothetical protein
MSLKLNLLTQPTQRQSGLWFCHAVDNSGRILSICSTDKFIPKLEQGAFIMIKDYDVKTVDDTPHVKAFTVVKGYYNIHKFS